MVKLNINNYACEVTKNMNNNLTRYILTATVFLSACAGWPTSGPSNDAIQKYSQQKDLDSKIQIIDVNQKVVTHLLKKDPKIKFSETLGLSNRREGWLNWDFNLGGATSNTI